MTYDYFSTLSLCQGSKGGGQNKAHKIEFYT